MRILLLTQILPYPPDAGAKVKTWSVLRHLTEEGHRVVLASFVRTEELVHLTNVKKICEAVHTVPISRSKITDAYYLLRSYLTRRPFLIERDGLTAMHRLVQNLLANQTFDVIHADQLSMAQFVLGNLTSNSLGRPLLVFDAHNAVWVIVKRMYEAAPKFLRYILDIEARRIKKYEGQVVHHFDHTITVSEHDRQALLQALSVFVNGATPIADEIISPSCITVIPISIDTHQLRPVRRKLGSSAILTLGTLHYPPNADGIRWFARRIFPQVRDHVPEATLTIVGRNPPDDFIEFTKESQGLIKVTGYVPDLTPYLEESSLMVVPVRIGGGMRVRILEGFAWAMPMVTTTVGLEGIDAQPGEHVLVADTEYEFATAVVQLLKDNDLQVRLATNGRRLVENHYDRRVVLERLDSVYEQITQKSTSYRPQ